jgi:hypothetical protein
MASGVSNRAYCRVHRVRALFLSHAHTRCHCHSHLSPGMTHLSPEWRGSASSPSARAAPTHGAATMPVRALSRACLYARRARQTHTAPPLLLLLLPPPSSLLGPPWAAPKAGVSFEDFDEMVAPTDNFYEFSTGGWMYIALCCILQQVASSLFLVKNDIYPIEPRHRGIRWGARETREDRSSWHIVLHFHLARRTGS